MLDWIFKYKVRVPGAAPEPKSGDKAAEKAADKSAAGAASASQAQKRKKPGAAKTAAHTAAVPAIDWAPKLQAAQGDDGSLLALARDAQAPLQTQLEAVAALAGEDALKAAEHHFRNHNRRVHSLAKQRLQALRTQRDARAQAARLIDAAQALSAETLIPVNSAVDLDRAWQALDSTLLQPEQRERYATLTAQLSALTRQRADHEAQLKRWQADAQQAQAQVQRLCQQAAAGDEPRAALAEAQSAAQALAEAAPAGSSPAPLQAALATAAALQESLALLEEVLQGASKSDTAEAPAAPAPTGAAAADAPEAPAGLPKAEVVVLAPVLAPGATTLDASAEAPVEAPVEAAADAPVDAAIDAPVDAPAEAPAQASTDAAAQAALSAALQPPADESTAPVAAPARAAALSPARQWQTLAALPDARLQALLQARFEAWQRSQDQARQQVKAQRRELVKEHKQAVRSERAGVLETALQQAEARLAEGLVAETHKHLIEIDELLHTGAPADALRARIGRLQDGYAELRGWQHWAGGRARDELAQEAQALAASCAPGPDGQPPKLQFKPHADLIDSLRTRWKELDRLGGASSRALWQRFEGALKAAYEPLAAMKAAQSAVREENLAARRALLDTLEAVPLPGAEDAECADGAGDSTPESPLGRAKDRAKDSPGGLRPAMAALDQFRVEWRKLGPVEHTVPRKAQDRLLQRMDAAVQRLHAPVDGARRQAEQERQSLIVRAQALAAKAQTVAAAQNAAPNAAPSTARGSTPGASREGTPYAARNSAPDLVAEVRTLQAQWQQSAQGLPLPRQVENALWGQFRTALDAVFSARDAAFSARDAEFKAHADTRAALIQRLQALLEQETAVNDVQRTLADVDTQWQRCGPAPRSQAGALEDGFRRARDAAAQWLAGSRQRAWQVQCDALQAKLALCEAHEAAHEAAHQAAAPGASDTLANDWAALPALPAAWEAALRHRAGLAAADAADAADAAAGTAAAPPTPAAASAAKLDSVLLNLEAAWSLSSPADQANARRELQLHAMKAALETRRPPQRAGAGGGASAGTLTPDQWLTEALRQPLASAAQRERLASVLAVLRKRGGVT